MLQDIFKKAWKEELLPDVRIAKHWNELSCTGHSNVIWGMKITL